jgi:PAS domain S-box-containing protein
MSRLFLKQVLLPFLVAGSFVLLDLFADLAADTKFHFALSHIFMDVALVLVTGFLALRGYRHAKALERANRSLQHAIEERQRAEARVQHLASFPQLNPNPVLEVDGAGNITYCNAAGDEMLAQLDAGFAPRTALPDDLAKVLQEVDPAKELRIRHELEVGTATFEALVHAIPAFNATRIYAHDITARKRAEAALREANERLQEQAVELEEQTEELRTQAHELADANEQLRESEQRFRLALKNAPVTVAAQDRDLRFLWAYNQRTVDPASIIGQTDADLFPPEDAARLVALKRRVLQTGEEISDQFWLTSGGQRVFLEVYLEPIRDAAGQITSIGIATVNLTERRRIEEALRDSEDRLRRIARAGRIGFYEWNAEQDNAYWSPEAYELFGREPGAPTGFAGWLACVHADDRERVARNATALLEQARTGLHDSSQRDEYRVVHDDGAVLWLEARTTFDLDGDHLVMRGAVRDITERKHAEAEIQQVAEALRAANEELTRFNHAMTGRELRMIELKSEVNALCERAGQPRRYPLDFEKEGM